MVQVTESLKNAIRQIATKGDPIVLVGAAGSGKSTMIESLALNEDVQNILAMREGGSVSQANVIVTDFSEIPEDCLITTVKLRPVKDVNLFDDNVWLGKIIYLALAETQAGDEEDYRKNLEKQLDWELEHPVSGTLACHLQKIEKCDRAKLLDAISSFPFGKISLLYKEALVKSDSLCENVDLVFSRLLSEPRVCYENIRAFWKIVNALDGKRYESLKSKLEGRGLVLEPTISRYEFTVVFNKDTMKDSTMAEIANTLLSPTYSESFLVEDTTLIFRGRKSLFEVDGADSFTVLEKENGEKVHCLRFIDTKGFCSEIGTTVDDEMQRIENILAWYYGDKAVFVVNANYSGYAEDVDKVLCRFFADTRRKRRLKVYFLYTRWDTYLSSCCTKANRFKHGKEKVHQSEVYEAAKNSLNDRTKFFENALKINSSIKKPVIKGSYDAALPSCTDTVATILENNNVSYFEALDKMVADMASRANKQQGKASTMSIF